MPLVTVLLATHDDARFLTVALESVFAQTLRDLELIVVDDASADATPELLLGVADRRLRVLRNDEQVGLAASLNRGLDAAAGHYVARLDADDVATPRRLELQVRALQESGSRVVGSAVRDLDAFGRVGRVHRMPRSALAVRWHALFSSPFFHPTVLVERDALERNALRYDTSFLESEDYDLWTRLLATRVEGANVEEPLVLKRVHPAQASLRRADLQRSFQRRVALREIGRVAPHVDADAAWSIGVGASRSREAARAYRETYRAFAAAHGVDAEVRVAAVKRLVRVGASRQQPGVGAVARVTVVSPEPTPYRAPLFDLVARRDDVELTVVYAAASIASRQWRVEAEHRATTLRGVRLPGARRALRHDYPVTPGIVRVLKASRPDVVIVSGWSTFAAQAAIVWSRAHGVPYALLVESHDAGRRSSWRRVVKDTVVPPIVRGAAAWLAVGTLARESLIARGADPERVRIFANTIDVDRWIARADELAPRREELRAALGVRAGEVLVLSVGRLVAEKGFRTLLEAAARVDEHARVAIAGEGPLGRELESAGATLLGQLDERRLAEAYAAADVFALLSEQEPWGVVVNEAAAHALPLVLSREVGAARDLLRDGENGTLVDAGDADAVARAIRRYLDPGERHGAGARSRELVRGWGYGPSADAFVAAVRDATASR